MLLHGVMIYQKDELANILIISPVYTMLNFWYGTDKIDTRTLGKIVKLILWNLRLHHQTILFAYYIHSMEIAIQLRSVLSPVL
jgi:hypothetical protein